MGFEEGEQIQVFSVKAMVVILPLGLAKSLPDQGGLGAGLGGGVLPEGELGGGVYLFGEGEAAEVFEGFPVVGGGEDGFGGFYAGVGAGGGQDFQDGFEGGAKAGVLEELQGFQEFAGGGEALGAGEVGAVVEGVDEALAAVGGADRAFGDAGSAVPEYDVAAFFLGKDFYDVFVQVEANDAGEAQGFIVGELGGLEGIPGEDEPFGEGVELGVALGVDELL